MLLSIQLRRRIESFLADHDLGSLYKEYNWGDDTWQNSFPDTRQLELALTMAARHGYLTKTHIVSIAEWGRLRNIGSVRL